MSIVHDVKMRAPKWVSDPNAASRKANQERHQREKERALFRSDLPLFLKNPETATLGQLHMALMDEPQGFPTRKQATLVANAAAARAELIRRGAL